MKTRGFFSTADFQKMGLLLALSGVCRHRALARLVRGGWEAKRPTRDERGGVSARRAALHKRAFGASGEQRPGTSRTCNRGRRRTDQFQRMAAPFVRGSSRVHIAKEPPRRRFRSARMLPFSGWCSVCSLRQAERPVCFAGRPTQANHPRQSPFISHSSIRSDVEPRAGISKWFKVGVWFPQPGSC